MSYIESICTGEFRINRRNKKRRIVGVWGVSAGSGQGTSALFGHERGTIETITGFFKINSSKRLRIFLDDGDELFKREKDDLLTSYKLTRRELKSFNQSDAGSFMIEYISWHVPPELCTQSDCYGDYYRAFVNPDMSDIYISPIIDSQKGESLRGNCLVWDVT